MHVLPMEKPWKDDKFLKQIIKAHSDKLLTFKKWDLFKKNGLEERIIQSLRMSLVTITSLEIGFNPTLLTYYKSEENWQVNTDGTILYPLLFIMPNERIIETYKQDSELTEFINSLLKVKEEKYQSFLEIKKQWVSFSNSQDN